MVLLLLPLESHPTSTLSTVSVKWDRDLLGLIPLCIFFIYLLIFCFSLSAVFGATYILDRNVDKLEFDENGDFSGILAGDEVCPYWSVL